MAHTVEFNQIYFEDWQKAFCFPFATPVFNPTLTPFFENELIPGLVLESKADKIGVCSWALSQKMKTRIPPRRDLTEEALQEDFDVMAFTKNSADHAMIDNLNYHHPGAKDILSLIWSKLGLPFNRRPKFPIYQNAFVARTEVYRQYVTEFLVPAMNLMTNDEEIRKLCWQDANYRVTTLGQPVNMERIQKLLGVPWYPLHPFLLERCFSVWIEKRGLKIVYL